MSIYKIEKSIYKTQAEIDRDNAKKSTGPKTEEGKRKSALNAMRHGLTGANFIMDDEDRAAWEAFSKPLIESLNPAGPMETQLAYLIAQDNYRLNRIHAMEENTFTRGRFAGAGNDAGVFADEGKTFRNLSLYEQRIGRGMHKNLKALQELQDRRKAEERQAAPETQKPKTQAAGAGPGPDHDNTFVFSSGKTPQPQQPNRDREGAATSPSEPQKAA